MSNETRNEARKATPRRCLAYVELDGAALKWLMTLPDPAHETEPELTCALVSGHDGPHAALAQRSGDEDYWFRWNMRAYEAVAIGACTSVGSFAGGPKRRTVCLLYIEHPGPHSYEYWLH
jgi:hypothetical protein